MPENTSLATQSDLDAINFSLQQLAENLAAHTNGSLSEGHGIGIFPGYTDADGNDLTNYEDSNGDTVGTYHIRFIIGGVSYWVPGQISTLDGQASDHGLTVNTQGIESRDGSSWVTKFVQDIAPYVDQVGVDYLLPHTELGHWEAHGGLAVSTATTTDNAGHTVGNRLIHFGWNGVVYTLVAHTRFGGPAQPPRLTGNPPANLKVTIPEGSGNSCDVPITFSDPEGTKPFTYQWQYYDDGGAVWQNFATGLNVNNPLSGVNPGWSGGINYDWASTSTITFRIINVDPGSDKTRSVLLRCHITNSAGSVNTSTTTFTAKDETGSWIMLEVMKTRTFTSTELFRIHKLRAWGFRHRNDETNFYTGPCGKELVRRMREAGFDFTALYPTVDVILGDGDYEERFAAFRDLILDSVRQFWPECDHPVIQCYAQV